MSLPNLKQKLRNLTSQKEAEGSNQAEIAQARGRRSTLGDGGGIVILKNYAGSLQSSA